MHSHLINSRNGSQLSIIHPHTPLKYWIYHNLLYRAGGPLRKTTLLVFFLFLWEWHLKEGHHLLANTPPFLMEFTIWIGPIDFALHRASVPSLCFRASTYDTPCFHSQIYHEVGPSFLYLRLWLDLPLEIRGDNSPGNLSSDLRLGTWNPALVKASTSLWDLYLVLLSPMNSEFFICLGGREGTPHTT